MKAGFDPQAQHASMVDSRPKADRRTIMAAAGVPDVVAELVLGHVQRGVQAVYNRHSYFEEKAEALDKLAAKLTDIIYERKAA